MIITFLPFVPIPIYLLYSILTMGSAAFYPAADWGPQINVSVTKDLGKFIK